MHRCNAYDNARTNVIFAKRIAVFVTDGITTTNSLGTRQRKQHSTPILSLREENLTPPGINLH